MSVSDVSTHRGMSVVGTYQVGAHAAEQTVQTFLFDELHKPGNGIAVVVSLFYWSNRVTRHSHEENI